MSISFVADFLVSSFERGQLADSKSSVARMGWLAAHAARLATAMLVLAGAPAISIAAQAPFSGSPIAVPATWEAENFDLGGEGVAYQDNVTGNAGGQYRTAEDVDLVASTDSLGGGFVVNNFETGEWLEFTINVPATGFYRIEVRASNHDWSPAPAFRVEIEGRGDVTGIVSVPSTGSWDAFQWFAKNGVYLVAGQQVLRLVATQQYFNLNSIRISDAPDPSPYSGSPIAIPGTWEAEDFDVGGEGVAYHDNVAGNAGGTYRANEDVDIVASTDPEGGDYVVNQFETGEWLMYTIDVASSGLHDIALRASNANWTPAPSFRLQVDGIDVTGAVEVPNTGSWSAFAWVTATSVHLAAGRHVLRVQSDRQYFDLNRVRIAASPPRPASLLFYSGFESATTADVPTDCYGGADPGCWQSLSGTDNASGDTWPPSIWEGSDGRFQLIADAPVNSSTVSNYIVNEMQDATVLSGGRALHSKIKQSGCCGTDPQGWGGTQDPYIILPSGLQGPESEGDLYVSYWLRFQPNLEDLMEVGNPQSGWHWRAFFEWKTAGDYRVLARIRRDPYINEGRLFWHVTFDNEANCPLYHENCPAYVGYWDPGPNFSVPVPVGQWFKVEIFWHRSSGSDGRVWMAVDGQAITDREFPNIGAFGDVIDRIMIMQVYGSSGYPMEQWVDDLQIWSSFPTATAGDPWYDPPYAPH